MIHVRRRSPSGRSELGELPLILGVGIVDLPLMLGVDRATGDLPDLLLARFGQLGLTVFGLRLNQSLGLEPAIDFLLIWSSALDYGYKYSGLFLY